MNTKLNSKMDKQMALESEMVALGIKSYWKDVDKAQSKGTESNTSYGRTLMARAIAPVADGIVAFQKENEKKRGRKHIALKYLAHIDPEVAAFIALRVCLDGITNRRTLQNVAVRIGSEIEDEVRLNKFANEKKPLFNAVKKHANKSSHRDYKSRVMTYAMNKYGIEWTPWPKTDKLHLGQKLVELITKKTGYIELIKLGSGGRRPSTTYYLTGTAKCREFIEKRNARCEMLNPELMPTIVPPKPWEGAVGGGYYSDQIGPLNLVKTSNGAFLEELDNRIDDMPIVVEATNALQDTAFRINKRVYEVMDTVWENDMDFGKFPPREDFDLPPCPFCGNAVVKGENHDCFVDASKDPAKAEDFKNWKRNASKTHERNAKLFSKRLQVAKVLWVADKYLDEEEFFYPYQMDFRGREYCVPMFLTPQGPDYAKALLSFAEGKPLTDDEGIKWLAIHGANVYGEDKCSLDARHQWVLDNQESILGVAEAPFENRFWTQADKPWQFLAFCFEWADFVKEGKGFVSTLPVHMDGSCNGLQLFSLMLRDEVGGKAVNCLPSDTPQDIYQTVADRVIDHLNVLLKEGKKVYKEKKGEKVLQWDEKVMARQWLEFGITRKTTKRQVMVVPYSGTQHSCREYTEAYIEDRVADGASNPWGDDTFKASLFLSKFIWDAIGETVIAAREAMDWLQKAARVAASEGLPVNWTTPAGLPVLQAYPNLKPYRVETRMGDQRLQISLNEERPGIDKRRQASGISPNFVHSLDAAALHLSIHEALKEGVTSFAMVHDSYGVCAQDAPIMARCLRKVFRDMFKDNDVLADLKEDIEALVSEDKHDEIPELPSHGNMDIDLVLESDFFFA